MATNASNEATAVEGQRETYDSNMATSVSDVEKQPKEFSEQARPEGLVREQEADVEKQTVAGATSAPSGTGRNDDQGTNVVDWDGDDDPHNPYNWAGWLKFLNCFLVSALSFMTPLASSMFAPGVPEIMREFGETNTQLGSLVVSIYVLGFAAGPLIFAPLSELYGRLVVYHGTNIGFLAFMIACSRAPSFNILIAFRFLAGLFGSVPLTNGGGSIADMIVQEKRGVAMSAFAVGPLLGPIIGPVAGGYVTDALGWRWVFYILAMVSGAITGTFFLFARETYAPFLLARKTKKLRNQTGNANLRSRLDPGLRPRDYFKRGLLRPLKMTVFSPICVIAGVYVALAYAYMYIMFTSLSPLFQLIYHFSVGEAGLSFLGLGVGSMLGVLYFSRSSDRFIRKRAEEDRLAAEAEGREPGGMKPEYRLPPLKYGGLLLPVGLFIYGWTAEYEVHWIAPIIGTAVMGVANLVIFMMYLVDAFTIYAASALASNAVLRSILGAVLPLAAPSMYDRLGLGWGNSLLGFIALVMVPAPWVVLRYGEYLRTRFAIKDL